MTAPAAVVSSRRISAGIRPDPGATSRLPAWWGADDWLEEVADALTDEVCRQHRIARDTVLAVARGHADYADYRTGRECRPTNERLTEVVRVSLSTIKRGRRVLRDLGLLVELVRGRSMMTREERLAAWRRGSSWRQVAAEFALVSRRRRAPKRRATKVREGGSLVAPSRPPVEGDPPPGATKESSFSHLCRSSLRRRNRNEEPLRGTHNEERAGGGIDPAARRLAETVQRRVEWLRGVSARRTAPTLARFARAGWTAEDVRLAVRDSLAARGWRVPAALLQPAAYLAKLLRDLDPDDRPTRLEAELAAAEAAERHFHDHLRVYGPRCPHGEPAGDVPSPLRGLILCPSCRRAAAGAGAGDSWT